MGDIVVGMDVMPGMVAVAAGLPAVVVVGASCMGACMFVVVGAVTAGMLLEGAFGLTGAGT